jgi:hypothetical protein
LEDGRFVLRSYSRAYVYGSSGQLEATLELPEQEQGESVAGAGPDTVLVGSEGVDSAVWEVALPKAPAASGEAPSSAAPRPDERGGPLPAVIAALVAGAVALAAAAWLRRRPDSHQVERRSGRTANGR